MGSKSPTANSSQSTELRYEKDTGTSTTQTSPGRHAHANGDRQIYKEYYNNSTINIFVVNNIKLQPTSYEYVLLKI